LLASVSFVSFPKANISECGCCVLTKNSETETKDIHSIWWIISDNGEGSKKGNATIGGPVLDLALDNSRRALDRKS